MEEPAISQYTDHDTVAREWSGEQIYKSLVMHGEADDGPMIAAAGLQDNSVLRILLERARLLADEEDRLAVLNQANDPYIGGTEKWTTPLLRAIERGRTDNVRLLLENGADPNGAAIQIQRNLTRLVRRFWRVDAADLAYRYPDELPYELSYGAPIRPDDVGEASKELCSLTEAETEGRRGLASFARFWTEGHKKGLDYSRDDTLLNSVVRAGTSQPEIFDQLLSAGADAHLWLQPSVNEQLVDEEHLSPSTLALLTPLHAAIASNNMPMLRFLLERGFNPHARAIITGSLAVTPAQYAIVADRLEAFSILQTHDQLDLSIPTPVYHVHILHFATALLRKDLVRAIGMPLRSASVTALGHTLLHVACLPYNAADVQTSRKVEQSIHDVRNLRDTRYILHPPEDSRFDASGKKLGRSREGQPKASQYTQRDIADELHRQEEICKLVISELGSTQIGLTDIHGNTALHYLAGAWYRNESLISWMRDQLGGEYVWTNAENMWGHTPLALWEENHAERGRSPAQSWDRWGRHGGRGRGRGGMDTGRDMRRRGLG